MSKTTLGGLFSQLTETRNFTFENFTSPFFDEVSDDGDLFNEYPIVPFFGNQESSSDSILKTIYRLSETVPVVSGIVDSIASFATSAGFSIKKTEGLGVLSRKKIDAEQSNIDSFEKAFLATCFDTDLFEIAGQSAKSLTLDGNAGYLVTVERTTKKAKIKYINTNNFRFLDVVFAKEEIVMIASSFHLENFKAEKPVYVPVYPEFVEEDGVIKTFVHAKKNTPNRKLYGFANGASSVMQQYLLNQLIIYLSALADNQFTAKVMLDVPVQTNDLNSSASTDIAAFEKNLQDTFTAKGAKKKSVMVHYRHLDTPKVEITQFAANTDHDFYTQVSEMLENAILKSFSWNKSLIGDNSDAGLFGEKLESVYMGASQKVKGTQTIIASALNKCFAFIEEHAKVDLLGGSNLVLNSVYQAMIDEKDAKELKNQEKLNENERINNTKRDSQSN